MRLRKKTIAVTTTAFVIAGTTAALAFWTTNGSGSGTVTTGDTAAITFTVSADTQGLVPGGTSNVSVSAEPSANTGDVLFESIDLAIDTGVVGCDPADFTIDPITGPITVSPAGGLVGSSVLTFQNTALNQDACKGATITITATGVPAA